MMLVLYQCCVAGAIAFLVWMFIADILWGRGEALLCLIFPPFWIMCAFWALLWPWFWYSMGKEIRDENKNRRKAAAP